MSSSSLSAEELKEKGNKAFASQKFDDAIQCYTNAIKIDNKNHVFFSNRSACHAGKKQWNDSINDAKECIRLNPSFVKGYYRLATAQMELSEFDAASSTIKQGLVVEPDNVQLTRLLRNIKKAKKNANASNTNSSAPSSELLAASAASDINNSAANEELKDLQNQLRQSIRDYNIVSVNINKAQKELKMNEITKTELENMSRSTLGSVQEDEAEESKINLSSSSKMYKGIGKMFMLHTKEEINQHMLGEDKKNKKALEDLTHKKEYLERRMKSQQQNIMELRGVSSGSAAASSNQNNSSSE